MVSVIICTHNPRADFLSRALTALQAQTLIVDEWELIVVDNASGDAVCATVDLTWHPNGACVREEQLGLTPARARGIRESRGDLIVFADDDNVLRSDYLEHAVRIAAERPQLGAWGGQIDPVFEVDAPDWTKPFWPWLGLRSVDKECWSNNYDWDAVPCGAGMCVRRRVAEAYMQQLLRDERRSALDRTGDALVGSGDIDLAFTACDIGLGIGRFPELVLQHLIPVSRLTRDYLLRLAEGNGFSGVVLAAARGRYPARSPLRRAARMLLRLVAPTMPRAFELARMRGERRGLRTLRRAATGIAR